MIRGLELAEENILKELIFYPNNIENPCGVDAFSDKKKQLIYRAVLNLRINLIRIDKASVCKWLYDKDLLDNAGGKEYVAKYFSGQMAQSKELFKSINIFERAGLQRRVLEVVREFDPMASDFSDASMAFTWLMSNLLEAFQDSKVELRLAAA